MAVNLRHQFFAAQAVWPMMTAAGGGSIVNFGSVSWMIGQGGMPGYTTAKSAIMGLTRALARDLGPDNIRVNSIVPGWIMTERQVELWLDEEGERELMQRQCLKRKLYPDDIARGVVLRRCRFRCDDQPELHRGRRLGVAMRPLPDGGHTPSRQRVAKVPARCS